MHAVCAKLAFSARGAGFYLTFILIIAGFEMANLIGGVGDDNLVGTADADTLDGGLGNDILNGQGGNDTYYFGRGDGQDFITYGEYRSGRSETLIFKDGILPSDLRGRFIAIGSGTALELSIAGTNDSIIIQDFYDDQNPSNYYNPIQQAIFSDGTVWGLTELTTLGLQGTSGDDALTGTSGNDTFMNSAGNDTLNGQSGDDTYYFGKGDGQDFITYGEYRSGRSETLIFKDGVLPSDLRGRFIAIGSGTALELSIAGTNDSIIIQDFYDDQNPSNYYNPIQQAIFSDGTVWGLTELTTLGLQGTSGDDALTGTSGNDTFMNSAGNDTLNGQSGDDTYYFGRGDGQDFITYGEYRSGRSETLIFKDGVLPSDLRGRFIAIGSGTALELSIAGTNDSIIIQDFYDDQNPYNYYNPIQQVVFSDGTTWGLTELTTLGLQGTDGDDSLTGTGGNDTFMNSAGNDTLNGQDGDDTYYFGRGDGQDLITYGEYRSGRNETLRFKAGVLPSDLQARFVGNALELSIAGTTDSITIQYFYSDQNPYNSNNPIQQVIFSDGTTWGLTELTTIGLQGTAENDYLQGTSGNDTFGGSAGDDTLNGNGGDDTYTFGIGDGHDLIRAEYDNRAGRLETLAFDSSVVPSGVSARYDGSNLHLVLKGTDDRVVIESFTYDNWSPVQQVTFSDGTTLNRSQLQALALAGVTGSTSVNGTAGTDTLAGASGDDTLNGNAGADLVSGGVGDDSLQGGDGNDTLTGGSGWDRLSGGNDNDQLEGGSGRDTLAGDAGDDVMSGGADADDLSGGDGNDTLDGGAGNDTLYGNAGTNLLLGGEGNDSLVSNSSSGDTLDGGLGNDSLEGGSGADLVTGGDGNDRLGGNDGSDSILGGSGDDTIYGGNGSDTIEGGTGNDYLNGQWGDDTYLFGLGDGRDTISGADNNSDVLNTLQFKAGIAPGDIQFTRDGSWLHLSIAGTTDRVSIEYFFSTWYPDYNDVHRVVFADGTVWDKTTLEMLSAANVIVGTSASETLTGTAGFDYIQGLDGNDSIAGLAGADFLFGGNGADTLDGGEGNDQMNGGAGDDVYLIDMPNDAVFEAADGGIDTVISTSPNYGLSANVENGIMSATGGSNFTYLDGNALDNHLTGNDYSNNIDGQDGHDTMAGGGGNDSYTVRQAGDVVVELANGGTDKVNAWVNYTLGDHVEELYLTLGARQGTGNALDNVLYGSEYSQPGNGNVLHGLAGNDLIVDRENYGLDGGLDTLIGGVGDDTMVVHESGDIVVELAGEGIDEVRAWADYTLADHVERLVLRTYDWTSTPSPLNGTGNALDNTLTGSRWDNTLDGAAGADTLIGGLGDDTYVVDSAGDVVTENAGEGTDRVMASRSWTLGANVENLTLTGTAAIDATGNELANALTGNSAANTLDGRGGADTMAGGAGDDTYEVDDAGDVITENASEGTDLIRSSVTYTASDNVEHLTLTGTATLDATGNELANQLTGNAAANALTGLAGNDTLDGGAGADTLTGGTGDDTYVVDNAADVVSEAAAEGTDLIRSAVTYTASANVENLTLTGSAAITATGNDLANTLTGNAGANVLDGGAGVDTMAGGAGNDSYVVDNAGDVVTEAAGAGTDLIQSAVSYTAAANVENLTLTGAAAVNATGNALANTLTGNAGANVLDGAAGADTMAGGAGSDTYVVDNAGDVVTEAASEGTDLIQSSVSFTASANVENLTLTGSAAVNATGNTLANTLIGNAGANVLDGGAGADTLTGGAGNDTYVVDNVSDVITEAAGEGTDTVQSSLSWTLGTNLENLTLTSTAAINATGNALANTLTGNAGANVLDGATGADTMVGGAGDDTYTVDNTGDVVTEATGEGTDLILSSVSYTASVNVENLTLTGSAATSATGNVLANALTGNAGANVLDGGAGTDTMVGGAGDDTYVVDDAGDLVTETASEGTDLIQASVSYTASANVENLTLTGSAAVNATGNELANALTGNAGANVLDGSGGADTMTGGAGNDTYVVDNAGDVVTEAVGEGADLVQSSVSYTTSTNVENLTLTGTAAINATGNTLANALSGNAGANVLDGGAGADTMLGGAGNDTYVVDNAGDIVTEAASEGTDLIESSVSYTAAANVENLTLTGTAAVNATGNALANTTTGNTGANVLDGAAGADTMAGGAGDDTYVVDNAGDLVTEAVSEGTDLVQSSVSYTASTNVENVTLTGTAVVNATGNALANALTGNAGANILDGGAGADTVAGGSGNDTYVVDNAGDVVTEAASEGTDLIQSSVSYTASVNVENLTLTGMAAINATGNALANTLTGNAGANVLDGGAGADTMVGGAGNDTYVVENAGDVVTEAASEGTDLIQSSVSYTAAANIENLTLTGTGAINATGNTLANLLTGNASANVLDGGAGADTMAGGAGNDTYVVDAAGDVVTENSSEGTDLIQSSVSFTASANVENLTLTGTAAINATGNDMANTLTGNAGANVLDGGAGADTVAGGSGNDTYVVDNAGDVVTEAAGEGTDLIQSSVSYTASVNVENLTLTGMAAINATGNALANTLTGNAGANVLDGGAGADTMVGGAGNDTYVVENAGDVVTEAASEGTDLIRSSVSYTASTNVENLTLTGTAAINATGNYLANTLTGNAGANVLDGGSGADTMSGGAGNDTYVVDNAGDVVTEAASEGTDLIQSSVSHTASSNVENLTLTGSAAINATGNTLANALTGNAGANVLDGGAGADTMVGGAGNDTYVVDNTGDVATEAVGEGTDLIQSSVSYTAVANVENLTLTGSAAINATGNTLANVLTGNASANVLDGAAGADTMVGGAGNDTYVVDNAGDVVTEATAEGTDLIQSSVSYTASTNVENLTLTGTAAINATGNTGANGLTGNTGNNILDGGAGADTMAGGLGSDAYWVDQVGDVVIEAAGAGTDKVRSLVDYTLGDHVESLELHGDARHGTGNSLDNEIIGSLGADVLTGLAGDDSFGDGVGGSDLSTAADTMIGGLGNDRYVVHSNVVVVELAGEGQDSVESWNSYTLSDHIESLRLISLDGSAGNNSGTGNALGNELTGNQWSNLLTGLAGNDTLDGGAGIDTLVGGTGDDTFVVDNAGDVVTEAAGEGTDLIQSAVSFTAAANVENLTLTGSAAVNATGNALANLLTGNAAANVLDGGAGDDVMTGGLGNDTYVVDSALDVVTELAGEGADTVQTTFNYTLGANLENLTLTGSAALSGFGNTLDNLLTGNTAANRLEGLAGADTLDGGAGIDTLVGGTGNDTYVVESTGDRVIERSAADGLDIVLSAAAFFTLETHVENLTLTGSASIGGAGNTLANVLTGNAGNNLFDGGDGNDTVFGGAGNDSLYGGAGADSLLGGAGDDTYRVGLASDVVVELANEGVDTVEAYLSWTLGANVENVILTGAAYLNATGNDLANRITGNDGYNLLTGGAGHDTIDGGVGADTAVGGTGDDTYLVNSSADVITELANEGTDTVLSTARSFMLGANVEHVTLQGTGSISATGNTLANTMTGNAGDNTLDGGDGNDSLLGGAGFDSLLGGAGSDTMVGGADSDFYRVGSAGDVVIELAGEGLNDTVEAWIHYTLGAHVEHLTLGSTNTINGTGNSLNNILTGNAANNVLDGLTGADTMAGGAGNDTYFVDNAGDVVNEGAAAGIDQVNASVSYTLKSNVERLTLTGSGNLNGYGGDDANTITGNAGHNLLDGGAGGDTLLGGAGNDTLLGNAGDDSLVGGTGNDTYRVASAGDVVVELASEGTDSVEAYLSYTLGANVENVALFGSAVNATGNALANQITGNSLANTLNGGAGNDTYVMGRGSNADVIQDSDATAGNLDMLSFTTGIATDQLWFRALGNDLEVSIIGTSDKATVKDWYLGSQNHLEQFRTADGKVLLDTAVDNLVNAMASFAPPAVGQTTLTASYQVSLSAVIAANWS